MTTVKENMFLDQLSKNKQSQQVAEKGPAENMFLKQLEGRPSIKSGKEKPLTWTEGLGPQSLYRIPGFAAQGAAAAAAGEPGDILSLAHGGANLLTGSDQPYEKSLVGKALPSTEQFLKGSPLQPQNKVEKLAQDISKDFVKVWLPGKYLKLGKYALGPLRSFFASTGANLLGRGITDYTGNENAGDAVKSGTLFSLSLMNPENAKNAASYIRGLAEKALPEKIMVNGKEFFKKLIGLESRILKGRARDQLAPSEQWVLDQSDTFKRLVKGGKLSIPSLMAQKTSFNERAGKQLYEIADRTNRARAKEQVKHIYSAVFDEMSKYGKINPKWYKLQKGSDLAYQTIAKSNVVEKSLQPLLKGREGSAVAHLFGTGVASAAGAVSKPLTGIATGAYYGGKYLYRISKSPVLARHYGKVIWTALNGNKAELSKALNTLNKALESDDHKRHSKE